MIDLFIKRIKRGEGKELILFSKKKLNYKVFGGLPPVSGNQTQLRFHPTRSEWVGYSTTRQNRTFLPNTMECPLCSMTNDKELRDIPVNQYEVAIFTNRFSSIHLQDSKIPSLELMTKQQTGTYDVISYTSKHQDHISNLPQ